MGSSDKSLSDRRAYLVLFALWLLASALNIAKPFHLDDTAHLIIAQNILNAPLHPMSGLLNWLDTAEPVFVTNQPHLFYYLIAGVIGVFGTSELVLHIFLSLFTAVSIGIIYTLSRRFVPAQALIVTAAIVVSPGFLINQNVMADIPLLTLIMLAVLILTGRSTGPKTVASGFAVFSLALMTKYTALFLYPALIWSVLRKGPQMVWALLPPAVLLIWSLFNLYDFGLVHILNRPANVGGLFPSPKLAFAFICNIGVFALPIAVLLMLMTLWQWVWVAVWAVSFAAYYGIVLVLLKLSVEPLMALNGALFASGVVVGGAVAFRVCHLGYSLWTNRWQTGDWLTANMPEITLVLWLAGGAIFLSTFPPFMATRHVLLLAPPLIILALRGQKLTNAGRAPVIVLAFWGAVGLFVTLNDIHFARFYRDMAPVAARRAADLAGADANVFARGHWGWQWYARQAGLVEFDSERSALRVGDILVDPVGISSQFVADIDDFVVVETLQQSPSIFGVLDTHSFYASGAVANPVFAPGFTRKIRILRKEK